MRFVASATLKRFDLRGLLERWERAGTGPDPFSEVILTPLPGLSAPATVHFVREHFVGRSRIWFDSGGYYVQQGEITYEDLYGRLMDWCLSNRWAEVYVLPDYVPSSDLSDDEVAGRIHATIAVTRLFSRELPEDIRQKALPVVQGHTREQIRSCVDAYLDMGYRTLGFGSFDTTGAGKDINILTRRALSNLEFLQDLATRFDFQTHAFGIGTPALIPVLYELGISSFDSSCWIRTAGFGNVLLPFLGRRNVSHGMLREIGGSTYNAESFATLKAITNHECPFCQSFEQLQDDRLDQALHNLLVIRDTVAALKRGVNALTPAIQTIIGESRYVRLRMRHA
ncbi:MAG: queuine tRNA-ribosyltransferase family protein [Chloroflexales bacterium]|nr:queuine tRNA-ribosyltransferase family protein [Chloroflexales bacterium]